MNPTHNNPTPTLKSRVAHAPYNFVPLPEQIVRASYEIPNHDNYTGNTGYLDCTLTTLTPTYTRTALDPDFFARWGDDIRGMMRDDQARTIYSQFLHLDDAQRPVIPGSSLRGMVRALIEVVGYGKMQWVGDKNLIFRAVGDPSSLGQFYRPFFSGPNKAIQPDMHFEYPSSQVRGGYLKVTSNGYAIQPAKQHKGESFVRVADKDAKSVLSGIRQHAVYDIFVEPIARSKSNRGYRGKGLLELDVAVTPRVNDKATSGLVQAKLVISGNMGGAHPKHWHCAIYEPDTSVSPIPIPERLWMLYTQDLDISRKTRRIENDGNPLFYLVTPSNELIFFGPTLMFRIPYQSSPLMFVPSHLKGDSYIDLAEAIFGYLEKGGMTKSRAGRVFFTDAVCMLGQENIYLPQGIITSQILGSPKPTTFQHYLVQDKGKDHDPNQKEKLAHYGTPTPDETVIRGHKFYWHKNEGLAANDFGDEDPDWRSDTQHTQIKPVAANIRFRFRVYFENLTDVELGSLLWVLDMPEGHCHKIGMGKPLGLGSADIKPRLVITHRPDRYCQLFDGNGWHTGEDTKVSREKFKDDFEEYILMYMDPLERGGAHQMSQLSRIQMLLELLKWPGPNPNQTRYMTIAPNQYKERPVLPDPLNVGSKKSIAVPPGSGTMHKSAGSIWLENIAKEIKIDLDGLIKKRPSDLPKRWKAIPELKLKREVLKEIVAQLKIKGIWDNPPTNKLKEMVQFFKSQIDGSDKE